MRVTQRRAIFALLAHLHAKGQRQFELSESWLMDVNTDDLCIKVSHDFDRNSLIVTLYKPDERAFDAVKDVNIISDAEYEIVEDDLPLPPKLLKP